jgi:hypothetical protein
MAEMASYIGIEPRIINAAGVAIARGLRATLNSSGTYDLAGIGVKGDMIALADIEANKPGPAASLNGGGKVPAVASEAVAVGDAAYSAASGQCSKTSAGAVALGKWTQPASGAGVLSEIETTSAPPTLSLVVTDNFNRADGALGANWTKITPATGGVDFVEISSNRVKSHFDDAHSYAAYTAVSFNDDQYSQVRLINIGAWSGPIVRAKQGVDRFYIGMIFAPTDYRIYLRWDGNYTQLAQASAVTWAAGDIAKITVEGSTHPMTLKLYRNGVQVLSYVTAGAAEETTGGSPGMGLYSPAGVNLRMDDWEGGNL